MKCIVVQCSIFRLFNVKILINFCLVTLSDNIEVAYLKTLTKDDIIKFYKVSGFVI